MIKIPRELPNVFANKPIIGLAGGIGAGKSFVAAIFAESGCLVLDADEAVWQAYREKPILDQIHAWWGEQAFEADGQINRRWISARVFADPSERQRLETLLHPRVQAMRSEKMSQFANDISVLAFVWDVPLLFETGLDRQCDFIVFVDSPYEMRQARVSANRGWLEADLIRRENLQMPLDKKRQISDYAIVNAADAAETRRQVRDVLSQILQSSPKPNS